MNNHFNLATCAIYISNCATSFIITHPHSVERYIPSTHNMPSRPTREESCWRNRDQRERSILDKRERALKVIKQGDLDGGVFGKTLIHSITWSALITWIVHLLLKNGIF